MKVNQNDRWYYSHSGSVYELSEAIRAHVDPLGLADVATMTASERNSFYNLTKRWGDEPVFGVNLDDVEISQLVTFLGTLEFDSEGPVAETE